MIVLFLAEWTLDRDAVALDIDDLGPRGTVGEFDLSLEFFQEIFFPLWSNFMPAQIPPLGLFLRAYERQGS